MRTENLKFNASLILSVLHCRFLHALRPSILTYFVHNVVTKKKTFDIVGNIKEYRYKPTKIFIEKI